MLVDSVMRRSVVTLPAAATARDAARHMAERRIGCVVVTEAGRPVGILTERDLAWRVLAAGLDPDRTVARAIMSSPLATIEPAASLDAAAARMRELNVKRLVVVLGTEVRGIITTTDIAYARPEVSKAFLDTWVKARWED